VLDDLTDTERRRSPDVATRSWVSSDLCGSTARRSRSLSSGLPDLRHTQRREVQCGADMHALTMDQFVATSTR